MSKVLFFVFLFLFLFGVMCGECRIFVAGFHLLCLCFVLVAMRNTTSMRPLQVLFVKEN